MKAVAITPPIAFSQAPRIVLAGESSLLSPARTELIVRVLASRSAAASGAGGRYDALQPEAVSRVASARAGMRPEGDNKERRESRVSAAFVS